MFSMDRVWTDSSIMIFWEFILTFRVIGWKIKSSLFHFLLYAWNLDPVYFFQNYVILFDLFHWIWLFYAPEIEDRGGGHIVFVPTVIPEFYNVILSEKLTLLITLDSRDGSVEERSSRMRENGVLPLVLIVWALLSQSRIFHSHGDVTITGEGLQILTYARHSWSLHIEGSLTCSTDWYTWHPFTMVISEDPRRSHLLTSVSSGAVTTFFTTSVMLRLEFEHQTFRLRSQRSNPLRHRRGSILGRDSNIQPSECDTNTLTESNTAVAEF